MFELKQENFLGSGDFESSPSVWTHKAHGERHIDVQKAGLEFIQMPHFLGFEWRFASRTVCLERLVWALQPLQASNTSKHVPLAQTAHGSASKRMSDSTVETGIAPERG